MLEFQTLLSVFLLVFTAELGDKTQLVALSLTGSSGSPWPVFTGSALALTASTAIAVFAGRAASETIPKVAPPLSAALFFFFGTWLLIKKEIPLIKQAFLNATLLEKEEAATLQRLFKVDADRCHMLAALREHELHHAAVFRRIIKSRALFADDINADPRLPALVERLSLPGKLHKQPLPAAFTALRGAEQACIDFYTFLLHHLEEGHHRAEEAMRAELRAIIREEIGHEQLLNSLLDPAAKTGPDTLPATRKKTAALVASAFLLVFFAELGDKTQLSAFSAAASIPATLSVFLGASLALVASSLLSVTLGRWLSSRIRERTLALVSGVFFLGAGGFVLVRYLT